jgi:hypothetical protein
VSYKNCSNFDPEYINFLVILIMITIRSKYYILLRNILPPYSFIDTLPDGFTTMLRGDLPFACSKI